MQAQSWIALVVGVFGLVGVIGTVRQRIIADARTQAWQRITWCLDHTVSDNGAEAELGWRLFGTVTRSKLITGTERDVLIATAVFAAERELAGSVDSANDETESTEEGRP